MTATTAIARAGRPRVLVVGACFGGLATIRHLRHAPVDVTVIDRTNYHLFQPLVYQVATGLLSPGEIAPALREVLRRQDNTTVLLAETSDIDLDGRQIEVHEANGSIRRLPYDHLVVAAGSHDSYFGHDEWAQHLYPMKTLAEAARLRAQLLGAYEQAAQCPEPTERSRWLTFVVVGAGPTGVEIAGQLATLADELRLEWHRKDSPRPRIVLIDALGEVLSTFPQALRSHARQRLSAMGVDISLTTAAEDADADGITVKAHDGHTERIFAHTVIWAAGVHASPLAGAAGSTVDHKGRVAVRPDCSLPGSGGVRHRRHGQPQRPAGPVGTGDPRRPLRREGPPPPDGWATSPSPVHVSRPGHDGDHLADGCDRGHLRPAAARSDRQACLGNRAHRIPCGVGPPGWRTGPMGVPAR
ncbi:MAG: NAD(P)/FAD-dependent oxidoreductase [Propionibacteriaceae bacterium]